MATRHLIDQGHQEIAGVFKQDDMQGHGRYEGYVKAVREAGYPVEDNLVTWYTTETKKQMLQVFEGQLKERQTAEAKEASPEGPSAYVIYNDQIAMIWSDDVTADTVCR